MSYYDLPTTVMLGGTEYDIRSDYRVVFDLFEIMADKDLENQEKAIWLLIVFYPDAEEIPIEQYQNALNEMVKFIDLGSDEKPSKKKIPKLIDWKKDFKHVVAPINVMINQDIRSMKYLHWWTFMGYFNNIGDCYFAQIVRVRNKRAYKKPLDKQEREFYRRNQKDIDFETNYSDEEKDFIAQWI